MSDDLWTDPWAAAEAQSSEGPGRVYRSIDDDELGRINNRLVDLAYRPDSLVRSVVDSIQRHSDVETAPLVSSSNYGDQEALYLKRQQRMAVTQNAMRFDEDSIDAISEITGQDRMALRNFYANQYRNASEAWKANPEENPWPVLSVNERIRRDLGMAVADSESLAARNLAEVDKWYEYLQPKVALSGWAENLKAVGAFALGEVPNAAVDIITGGSSDFEFANYFNPNKPLPQVKVDPYRAGFWMGLTGTQLDTWEPMTRLGEYDGEGAWNATKNVASWLGESTATVGGFALSFVATLKALQWAGAAMQARNTAASAEVLQKLRGAGLADKAVAAASRTLQRHPIMLGAIRNSPRASAALAQRPVMAGAAAMGGVFATQGSVMRGMGNPEEGLLGEGAMFDASDLSMDLVSGALFGGVNTAFEVALSRWVAGNKEGLVGAFGDRYFGKMLQGDARAAQIGKRNFDKVYTTMLESTEDLPKHLLPAAAKIAARRREGLRSLAQRESDIVARQTMFGFQPVLFESVADFGIGYVDSVMRGGEFSDNMMNALAFASLGFGRGMAMRDPAREAAAGEAVKNVWKLKSEFEAEAVRQAVAESERLALPLLPPVDAIGQGDQKNARAQEPEMPALVGMGAEVFESPRVGSFLKPEGAYARWASRVANAPEFSAPGVREVFGEFMPELKRLSDNLALARAEEAQLRQEGVPSVDASDSYEKLSGRYSSIEAEMVSRLEGFHGAKYNEAIKAMSAEIQMESLHGANLLQPESVSRMRGQQRDFGRSARSDPGGSARAARGFSQGPPLTLFERMTGVGSSDGRARAARAVREPEQATAEGQTAGPAQEPPPNQTVPEPPAPTSDIDPEPGPAATPEQQAADPNVDQDLEAIFEEVESVVPPSGLEDPLAELNGMDFGDDVPPLPAEDDASASALAPEPDVPPPAPEGAAPPAPVASEAPDTAKQQDTQDLGRSARAALEDPQRFAELERAGGISPKAATAVRQVVDSMRTLYEAADRIARGEAGIDGVADLWSDLVSKVEEARAYRSETESLQGPQEFGGKTGEHLWNRLDNGLRQTEEALRALVGDDISTLSETGGTSDAEPTTEAAEPEPTAELAPAMSEAQRASFRGDALYIDPPPRPEGRGTPHARLAASLNKTALLDYLRAAPVSEDNPIVSFEIGDTMVEVAKTGDGKLTVYLDGERAGDFLDNPKDRGAKNKALTAVVDYMNGQMPDVIEVFPSDGDGDGFSIRPINVGDKIVFTAYVGGEPIRGADGYGSRSWDDVRKGDAEIAHYPNLAKALEAGFTGAFVEYGDGGGEGRMRVQADAGERATANQLDANILRYSQDLYDTVFGGDYETAVRSYLKRETGRKKVTKAMRDKYVKRAVEDAQPFVERYFDDLEKANKKRGPKAVEQAFDTQRQSEIPFTDDNTRVNKDTDGDMDGIC